MVLSAIAVKWLRKIIVSLIVIIMVKPITSGIHAVSGNGGEHFAQISCFSHRNKIGSSGLSLCVLV
jgi:hypothetical protein